MKRSCKLYRLESTHSAHSIHPTQALNLGADGVTCAEVLVASESLPQTAHRVHLKIGMTYLSATCRCPGCLLVAGNGLGKHAVAALLVLSDETAFTLTTVTPASSGTSSGPAKPDARSKKVILSQGPQTAYPKPPTHSVLYSPREILKQEIIDLQLGAWASKTKGDVTGALRKHLASQPEILGRQCAPAFEKDGYIKNVLQERSRTTLAHYGLG